MRILNFYNNTLPFKHPYPKGWISTSDMFKRQKNLCEKQLQKQIDLELCLGDECFSKGWEEEFLE